MTDKKKVAGMAPGQGKLLATLSVVTPEDRARAGITDEMANAAVEAQQPPKKGVAIVKGPWQPYAGAPVEEQVRVIDYDANLTLFAGTAEQLAKLKKAITAGGK